MPDSGIPQVNRRGFLQTGAAATALSLASAAPGLAVGAPEGEKKENLLPKRPLGKTGVDVCILSQGTWKSPGAVDRLLRLGYASGVRYVDTAKSYGSEPDVAKWLGSMPSGTRKDIFLVTKDHPGTPSGLIKSHWNWRCEAARSVTSSTCLFLHGCRWPATRLDCSTSKEFKDTIEKIKKSGKARFVGFSCHDAKKVEYLTNAAEGGFVDAIMIAYSKPWSEEGKKLDRALDACHKAGIGLISMKQISGDWRGASPEEYSSISRISSPKVSRRTRRFSTRSGPTSESRPVACQCGTPTTSARTSPPRATSSR